MRTFPDRFDEVAVPGTGEKDFESHGTSGDRMQVRIADKLHQAADTLFGKTEGNQTPPGQANLGSQARSWLHSSADYIEQMQPEKIKADLTEQVRRNPGKSLLVAGAAGLVLAALFRRR